MAGFVTAILIIKAIKSFRQLTIWFFYLSIVGGVEAAISGTVTLHNTSGSIKYWTIYENFSGTYSVVGPGANQSTAANSTNIVSVNTDAGYPLEVFWKDTSGATYLSYNQHDVLGTPNSSGFAYDSWYGGAPTYTNYWGTIAFTNSTDATRWYTLTVENLNTGGLLENQLLSLQAGNGFYSYRSYPVPWDWHAIQAFVSPDQVPQNYGGTNNTPTTTGTNAPPNGPMPSPTPGTNDPYNVPWPTNNLPTNQIIADRQDTQQVINELERVRMQIQLQGPNTNSAAPATNDYRPYFVGASNQMNTIAYSNNLTGSELGDHFGAEYITQSNAAYADNEGFWTNSGLSSVMSVSTNWVRTETNVDYFTDVLFYLLGTTPNGHEFKIWFDPAHYMSGLVPEFLKVTSWLGKWFAWAITFVLWWQIVERLDDMLKDFQYWRLSPIMKPNAAATTGIKAFAWNLAKTLIKAFTLGLFLDAIMGALVAAPTALVTWITTHSIADPFSVAGPVTEVSNNTMNVGSTMWKMMLFFMNQLLKIFPLATIIAATINWLAFVSYSRKISMLVVSVLVRFGYLVPVVLLLLLVPEAKATLVRFENFQEVPAAISNGVNVIQIPVGINQDVVLDPGTWNMGAVTITIADEGHQVVRITRTMAGSNYCESEAEIDLLDWYMLGVATGWSIWGTAWVVSCVYTGFRLKDAR